MLCDALEALKQLLLTINLTRGLARAVHLVGDAQALEHLLVERQGKRPGEVLDGDRLARAHAVGHGDVERGALNGHRKLHARGAALRHDDVDQARRRLAARAAAFMTSMRLAACHRNAKRLHPSESSP